MKGEKLEMGRQTYEACQNHIFPENEEDIFESLESSQQAV
jgi:hypothetical protein